jgi:hypothetical protein
MRAGRLDLPSVDPDLLFGLANAGQVSEKVLPITGHPQVEPRLQPTQDLSTGVHSLLGHPGPTSITEPIERD